ncbi:methyltransferase domain-containing protein [Planktosalinus lacus]|uniref:Methyltransferase domain-containing protein n=1 Tax=Planktosalinus lacus TaxID=1526573 RepID=A0A8J2VAY1_9FLAO|nr:methyltransferase domain-containing protein [Planktosalinus lacus]GGD93508.1 hypothetical protein GCM10011312_16620 [Planktosalinus lacus]
MLVNTTYRSSQSELMDQPNLSEVQLQLAYNDINKVNKLLGGNHITLNGVIQLTKDLPVNEPVTIIDIGCGDGEILFRCEHYALENKLNWILVGLDNNDKSIALAKKRMPAESKVQFQLMDVFSDELEKVTAHIFLFSLTLHHFSNDDIIRILEKSFHQAKTGIVINDLQRSALAYRLFQLFSFCFLKSNVAKNDGLVSILRGFKKEDLRGFSKLLPQSHQQLKQKWAFRWQWIIQKK